MCLGKELLLERCMLFIMDPLNYLSDTVNVHDFAVREISVLLQLFITTKNEICWPFNKSRFWGEWLFAKNENNTNSVSFANTKDMDDRIQSFWSCMGRTTKLLSIFLAKTSDGTCIKFWWNKIYMKQKKQPFKAYFLLKNVYNLFFFYIAMIFVYILCDVFFLFHIVLFANCNQRWAFFNNLYLLDKIVRFELWPFKVVSRLLIYWCFCRKLWKTVFFRW